MILLKLRLCVIVVTQPEIFLEKKKDYKFSKLKNY